MINVNYAAQASAPIPVAAALPQIWIDSLMSNRWNFRRAALLYALANMDGPVLLAAYRLANQYRIVMDRTENDLLDRIAMKLNGHPVGLGAAIGAAFASNDLLNRGYLYAVQTGALAPHTVPVPTYAINHQIVPRQWPGNPGCGCGGGVRPCGCGCGCDGTPRRRVGLGFADMDALEKEMQSDLSNWGGGGGGSGKFEGEEGGSSTPSDPWGSGDFGSGGTTTGTEGAGAGSDPWGSEGGWGGDTPRGGASDPSDPFGSWGGSTPSTPKKPPAQTPGAKNWWDAIPAITKAATETATRAFCLANPQNAACGTIPQNSPQWIAYCRTNPGYPPCAQLLQQANIPPAVPGAGLPPAAAASEVPGWVWGVGAIALIALALMLL